MDNKIVVGLFDNDRAGNEQFKRLNKKVFEDYIVTSELRKHRSKQVYGMLLPVPPSRAMFVTSNNTTQRYLEIEHYFSDKVLRQYEMSGDSILGTTVFDISGDKVCFAENIGSVANQEFTNFELLFSKLMQICNLFR